MAPQYRRLIVTEIMLTDIQRKRQLTMLTSKETSCIIDDLLFNSSCTLTHYYTGKHWLPFNWYKRKVLSLFEETKEQIREKGTEVPKET